jgi:RNA polymerase sigma factor (sigma-70 family)
MARSVSSPILHLIRRADEDRRLRELPDQELLRQFAGGHEEAAFQALLGRHGPMVLDVCRGVLGDSADAEDAFQATFLVLVRKAGSIRKTASLGSWLHGVAYRTALKAKARLAGRHQHEARVPARPPSEPDDPSWREVRQVLHEELSRLPERYRAPLVLCYLEGATQEAAAVRLSLAKSTLRVRLERGRALLRTRLVRRGLGPAAFLAAAAWPTAEASACVPAALACSTVRAAALVVAGGADSAAVSARAADLAQEVGHTMSLGKGKAAVLVAVVVGLLGAGSVALIHQGVQVEAPPAPAREAGPPAVQARLDRTGDPLPAGAVARLGTVRFRTWADRVAFLPGDRVLATVGREVISFWDVGTGKETRRPVDMRWGPAYALSADGKTLAVAAVPNDSTIHLWEVATGRHLRQLPGPPGWIRALAFAPDGRALVSTGDRQVQVWDTATGKEVCRAAVGPADLGVAVSPDGKTLASAGWDVASAVSLRETATGKELHRYRLPLGVDQVVFAPDGKTLAAVEDWNDDGGPHENKVHLWDVATGNLRQRLALREHILGIAFSPDSKSLATGHLDTLHVWDLATGKWIERFEGHTGRIDHLAFSGDGKTLATGGDNTIRLWDVATGKEVPPPGDGHQGPVQALAFLGDGKTLITAGDDHTLRHWEAATGREVRRFPGTGGAVFRPSFAGANTTLALPVGNEVRLCDSATGQELRRFRFPGHVRQVALTPDGKTLAVYAGGKDLTLRLVDTATGKERQARRSPDAVQVLALSPDGAVLAVGLQCDGKTLPDGSVRLLDAATGGELHRLRLSDNAASFAFSPDGKTLATADMHGVNSLWEVATGKERAQLPDREQLREMTFSPDGCVLALGDSDGTIRLCLAVTGKELRRLRGHRSSITCLAFSADGKRLASGSWDTTALVWDVSGLPEQKGPQPGELGARQLEALWDGLASADAAQAYRAIQELAAAPGQAVPFLKARLRPVSAVEPERLASLLADMDSDDFAAREKATAELERLGEAAEAAVRKALQGKPSAEVRRRGEAVLHKLGKASPGPERLRELRALEVLEQIGGTEARQVLAALAGGMPGARLTRGARAALERLDRRSR